MERSFLMRVSFAMMAILFADYNEDIVVGKPILLHKGAVAYYRGGGWWRVSGYHWERRDVAYIKQKLLYFKRMEQEDN